MKQFFTVLFGGLAAIIVGIGLSYFGSSGWRAIRPHLTSLHWNSISELAASVLAKPTDGTSIYGFTRTIRWSASQEEDSSNVSEMVLTEAGSRKITALAYIVKDLSSATSTIISHNSNQILPIASLSKLVTAEVARRLIPSSTHILLTAAIMKTYGNTAEFRVGETFTAADLMYPLLMVSSNDAAEAYAQFYGRSEFIAAMNDFTQSIGAYRTYFADPSGLSPYNVSTVSDLALIIDWLHKNDPQVISITQLKSKTIRNHTFINPTHFLSWSNYAGGKNGYIPEANQTGASLFTMGKNKDLYVVVVLGSNYRDGDEAQLLGKIGE
jgi:D-alanyl-D-alanine carboxypeptidase